jgi:pimeloyl-ACP methyl ester carboxylesterase
VTTTWEEMATVSRHGDRLVASVSPLEKGLRATGWLLMMPGFTSKRKNKTALQLAQRLADKGVRCVALDLSGHGDSGGTIRDQTICKAADEIEDFIAYLQSHAWTSGLRSGILGSSFSGSAAIIAASRDASLNCLLLKSPVPDYVSMRRALIGDDEMARWKTLGEYTLPNGIHSSYDFIEDAERYDLYSLIRALAIPTLVVQGDHDEEIPPTDWEMLRESMPPLGEFRVILGGDHSYTDGRVFEEMLATLGNFAEQHLA